MMSNDPFMTGENIISENMEIDLLLENWQEQKQYSSTAELFANFKECTNDFCAGEIPVLDTDELQRLLSQSSIELDNIALIEVSAEMDQSSQIIYNFEVQAQTSPSENDILDAELDFLMDGKQLPK
jgi:uncharacterized membrane-anchored protein